MKEHRLFQKTVKKCDSISRIGLFESLSIISNRYLPAPAYLNVNPSGSFLVSFCRFLSVTKSAKHFAMWSNNWSPEPSIICWEIAYTSESMVNRLPSFRVSIDNFQEWKTSSEQSQSKNQALNKRKVVGGAKLNRVNWIKWANKPQ